MILVTFVLHLVYHGAALMDLWDYSCYLVGARWLDSRRVLGRALWALGSVWLAFTWSLEYWTSVSVLRDKQQY